MTAGEIRVCAVVPVYENASTVGEVAIAAAQHADLVIVVDDGSRDDTQAVARMAAARAPLRDGGRGRIVFLALGVNRGKGAALATGFRRARELGFTHAVTLDADGQHRASDIPALVAAAKQHPLAIVVGTRDMDADRVPNAARVGRRVSNFWTHRTTGFDLPDTTCGLRVYPLREVLALPVRTHRYDYEGEVLVRGAWAGLGLVSVPIDVWYPEDRATRVSHYRLVADSVRITVMFVRLALRRLLPFGGTGRVVPGAAPPRPRLRDALRHARELTTSGVRTNEVALAVGIGVFIGATPLWGLHLPLTLYVAARWRLNLVVSVLATNVSFPAIAPFLVFAEIQLGHLIRTGELLALGRDSVSVATVTSNLADYVVGGFVLAAVLGIASGLATLEIGALLARRRPRERAMDAEAGAT